jgi:hypothetical protein
MIPAVYVKPFCDEFTRAGKIGGLERGTDCCLSHGLRNEIATLHELASPAVLSTPLGEGQWWGSAAFPEMRQVQRSMIWSHFVEKCISLRNPWVCRIKRLMATLGAFCLLTYGFVGGITLFPQTIIAHSPRNFNIYTLRSGLNRTASPLRLISAICWPRRAAMPASEDVMAHDRDARAGQLYGRGSPVVPQ